MVPPASRRSSAPGPTDRGRSWTPPSGWRSRTYRWRPPSRPGPRPPQLRGVPASARKMLLGSVSRSRGAQETRAAGSRRSPRRRPATSARRWLTRPGITRKLLRRRRFAVTMWCAESVIGVGGWLSVTTSTDCSRTRGVGSSASCPTRPSARCRTARSSSSTRCAERSPGERGNPRPSTSRCPSVFWRLDSSSATTLIRPCRTSRVRSFSSVPTYSSSPAAATLAISGSPASPMRRAGSSTVGRGTAR